MKKSHVFLIALVVLDAVLAACLWASFRTEDVRTQVIAVPEMKNEACAQLIGTALKYMHGVALYSVPGIRSDRAAQVIQATLAQHPGVMSVQISASNQLLEITYDAGVPGMEKLEFPGFPASCLQTKYMPRPGIVIEKVIPDLARRQVSVTYNSMMIALKNLEFIIADAGFSANTTPANTNMVAHLPPECRD